MRFNKYLFLIAVITVFGFLIRIHKITTSPDALYIDETSIGYNAYSIIKTGHDEHGKFMPLFFEAFGEYKLPIYVYAVAIVQLIIGPSDLSVRIPSVIFGTLTIFVIYLFAKELLENHNSEIIKKTTPIFAAFLLSISPWHFQFSRPGFEASAGLFFLSLGLFSFFRAVFKQSTLFLYVSLVSFVCSLYSYNSTRIIVPIIGIVLFIFYFRQFSPVSWLKAFLLGSVISLPFILFSVSPEGLSRAKQVSIFYQSNNQYILQFLINYWKNISPIYLFVKGDPTIAHLTPFRMSLLYLVELPFFFLGIFFLLSNRSREFILILVLLLVGFIPPAISTLSPHALRGFLTLPATTFISALGFTYFFSLVKSKKLQKGVVAIYVLSLLISFARFLDIYHNKYMADVGWDWQVGIKKVGLRVLAMQDKYDYIYLNLDPRQIPALWYLKIDPALYQNSTDKTHFGKFYINQNIFSSHGLYAGHHPPGESVLLQYVYYPNHSVAYGIWEF